MQIALHHLPRPVSATIFSDPGQMSHRLWPLPEPSWHVPIERHRRKHGRNAVAYCLSIADSTAAVQQVLELSLKGDFGTLLEYVPDAAVEHALQRKRIFR